MNTRLTATQTNRLPQPCVKGCSFVTTRESGMCKACELAGEKMREPIAKTDPMPRRVDLFSDTTPEVDPFWSDDAIRWRLSNDPRDDAKRGESLTPWRDLTADGQASLERSQAVRGLLTADCPPEPSAPVLREADAVACDSGEVSHMELKPWVVVCGIGAVLVTLAALCMLGR